MRGRATSRLAAMAVAVCVLASACAGLGDVHAGAPPGSSPVTLATFEGQLRAAGIPTVAGFPPSASRFEVSSYQAQVMAAQLAGHQGVPGFQLDKEVTVARGMPPVAYLIAAWVLGAHTGRSATAKGWMGTQNWRDAPHVVFPAAVLVMFSVDMADHIASEWARSTATSSAMFRRGGGLARNAAGVADVVSSPCTTVDTFFGHATLALFNALHLSPDFLGNSGPLGIVGSFVAGIWNTLTDLVHGALTGIAATLTAPIAAAISVAVGAVGLISQASSFLGAWSLRVVVTPPGGPTPGRDRFAVGAEPAHHNTLVVSASSLVDKIPSAIRDCAEAFGSKLPSTLVPGSTVTWTVVGNENVVEFPDGLTAKVDQAGSATLAWTTGREPAALGTIVVGRAFIRVVVRNPGAIALADLARRLIEGAIARVTGPAAPAVKAFFDGIASPLLANIQSGTYDQGANVAFEITHHQCDRPGGCTATPPTTAAPTPSSTSTPTTVVRSCSIAPASLVGAVLGVPTAGPRQFQHGPDVIQCVYGTDVAQPAVLGFYSNMDAARFATLKAAVSAHLQNATSIAFQDEAFTSTTTGPLTLNSLYARKGSLVISVLSTASLRAEEALETRIFANVYRH